MRLIRLPIFAILLLFGSSGLTCAQDAPRGGMATLYHLDPESWTFSFTDNRAGGVMRDHRALNHGAEIDFGNYRAGSLSVGVSNDSTARIVDLGTTEALKQAYGYQETVGGGQGFASIHRKGTSLLIRQRRDVQDGTEYQSLEEGGHLLTDLRSVDSAPVALGHIYLVHIVKTGDWAADFFVKLMVVAYQAEQSVTIRWEILDPE